MHPLSKVAYRTECTNSSFGLGTLLVGPASAFTVAAMDNYSLASSDWLFIYVVFLFWCHHAFHQHSFQDLCPSHSIWSIGSTHYYKCSTESESSASEDKWGVGTSKCYTGRASSPAHSLVREASLTLTLFLLIPKWGVDKKKGGAQEKRRWSS